jgi:hypothetical protein
MNVQWRWQFPEDNDSAATVTDGVLLWLVSRQCFSKKACDFQAIPRAPAGKCPPLYRWVGGI